MAGDAWFVNQTLAPSSVLLGIYWGAPVRWQGWACLAVLALSLVLIVRWGVPDRWMIAIPAMILAIGTFLLVTVVKGRRVEGIGP